MNLMGEYAAANHAVIHRLVSKLLGAEIDRRRREPSQLRLEGAAPVRATARSDRASQGRDAGRGGRAGRDPRLDGRPGVRRPRPRQPAEPPLGLARRGPPHVAQQGATTRTASDAVRKELEARGIHVLAAGSDEVPGVYKDIRQVMAAQEDLVEIVAQFDPKIVRMCGDGSKAED